MLSLPSNPVASTTYKKGSIHGKLKSMKEIHQHQAGVSTKIINLLPVG